MPPAVIHAALERDGLHVVVRWELTGGDAPVDIGVGPSPDAVDHAHAVTAPGDQRSARLDDLGGGPCYVSVAPHGGGGAVIAGERRLPFEGVTNFRDLGGYPVAGGGRVRWGRVFRSDALHRFTGADLARYEALGLRAVYDLRSDLERDRYPNPFPSVALPLISQASPSDATAPAGPGGVGPGGAGPGEAGPGDGPEAGERLLRTMYQGLLVNSGPVFGRLLGGLAEPEALPAVFHCTGGKDRTGMSAALLLEVLGVERELVLDDYELTSRYRLREHQTESYENLLARGLGPEAAAVVLGAPRWAMAEALDVLDEQHGGIEAYLTGPAGLSVATLERLRDGLTG
jgi:protein-tyrosine phosphatase